jgi:hypothetical protein
LNDLPSTAGGKPFQFGLRGILLLVTAAAVLIAVLTPWLRDWEPSRLLKLAMLAATAGGWFILDYVASGRRQRRAEQQGGELRLLLPTLDARKRRIFENVAAAVMLVLWAALAVWTTADEDSLWLPCWLSLMVGMQIGRAYSDRLSQRIEFRENGLVHGGLFAPWSGLRKCAWQVAPGDDSRCTITAVFTGYNFIKIELQVCTADRQTIEELVAANTKLAVDSAART